MPATQALCSLAHVTNSNPQDLPSRVAALSQLCESMAGQLAECAAVTGSELPARLAEVEGRVQATAQTCADAVKVRGYEGWVCVCV